MPLVSRLCSTAGPPCHSVTFEGLKPAHPALLELEGSRKQQGGRASKAQTSLDLEPVGMLGWGVVHTSIMVDTENTLGRCPGCQGR